MCIFTAIPTRRGVESGNRFEANKNQSAVCTATVRVHSLVWQEMEYQMDVRKATNRATEHVAYHKDTELQFLSRFIRK